MASDIHNGTPTDINALTISDTPKKLSEEGMKVGRVVPANTILCTCIASIGKNALSIITEDVFR